MASKSTEIDWDEVLLTQDPKKKEIEVSFKRVDGGGFFSDGGVEPGTPPGAIEDANGCTNTVQVVSDDTFVYQDNENHWIWLVLRTIPAEYMEVDLQFTDGTMLYPEYTTQTLTWAINPGNFESDETGFVGKKVPLVLGTVNPLNTSGNYFVTITGVRGFSAGDNTPCFDANPVGIDFAETPAVVDPTPTPDGGPVPPEGPPNECLPGNDCTARWNRFETTGIQYDSMLLLRGGYPEVPELYQNYYGETDPVFGTTSESNVFTLTEEDNSTVIFDGRAESDMPSMVGTESVLKLVTSDLEDYVTKPASVLNDGQGGYESLGINYLTYVYPSHIGDPCNHYRFAAPPLEANTGWSYMSTRRYGILGSIWDTTYEVPDPANPPSEAIAVNSSNTFFSQSHTAWVSVFTGLSFDYSTNGGGAFRPRESNCDIRVDFPEFTHAHNGTFNSNTFSVDGDRIFSRLSVRPDHFLYTARGSGLETYRSPFKDGDATRQGFAWFTCKLETYLEMQWDADNSSGDYGIYSRGCKYSKQMYATWFWNGQQVTPKTLLNNFLLPPGYVNGVEQWKQKDLDYSVSNYTRNGDPMSTFSRVEADYLSHPISFSSRYAVGFVPQTEDQFLTFKCNQAQLLDVQPNYAGDQVPVLAVVDHSESGLGFFKSDQFKALLQTFDNDNPDYCQRIP